MNDEFKGKINDELVGLKSKIHSMKHVDGEECKTGKGLNNDVIKNIKHEVYFDFLFNKKIMR